MEQAFPLRISGDIVPAKENVNNGIKRKNVAKTMKVCYTSKVSYQQCLSTVSSLFTQGAFFYLIRKVRHLRSEKHKVFFRGLRFSASPFLHLLGHI